MIQKCNNFFVISKSSIIYWSFLLPNLLGVLYFSLLPMLQVLIRSFQSAPTLENLPQFVSLC